MPAGRGMDLRVRWLALASLAAGCVRAPEIPAALDPSRADAPEGVFKRFEAPSGAGLGAPAPRPEPGEEHEGHTPDHGHGGHGSGEEAPR